MPVRRQHFGDGEAFQALRRVFNAFDLKANAVEHVGYILNGRVCFEMGLQPGQGELHAPTPPLKVGTSRAANP